MPYHGLAAGRRTWHSAGVESLLWAADARSWSDIPVVRLLGVVLGTLLLIAAIRGMFGGRGRR